MGSEGPWAVSRQEVMCSGVGGPAIVPADPGYPLAMLKWRFSNEGRRGINLFAEGFAVIKGKP